jgi:GT2 family glycosyltransferase
MSKVALIYLSYHSDPYLDNFIVGLKKIDYPKENLTVVVVDQPHPEFGSSINILKEKLLPLAGVEIPPVVFLPQEKNLGFAGGNNIGIKWAIDNNFDYIFLHNQDGFVEKETIAKLVAEMENDNHIGAAQAFILLHPENDFINSAGNCFHYLGFGYSGSYRMNKNNFNIDQLIDVGYASGAAMMSRSDLLKKFGLLDEDFVSYHEDLEYCLRLRSVGFRIVLAPVAIFYHQYDFSKNKDKFYLMERNRYGAMLMYFKWPTLFLLLPMALLVEASLLLFALKSGWIREKLKAYGYWLKWKNWRKWLNKRQKIQSQRTISDREMLKYAVSKIDNWVLKYFANPMMKVYWVIMKILIWW